MAKALLAPETFPATSGKVQQAAGFTAFLDRESPDTVRRNPAKTTSSDPEMLLLLVVSDRPGFAGKTTMLTYIQINVAKPKAKAWSLADARVRRDEAKKKIARGIDPALEFDDITLHHILSF